MLNLLAHSTAKGASVYCPHAGEYNIEGQSREIALILTLI